MFCKSKPNVRLKIIKPVKQQIEAASIYKPFETVEVSQEFKKNQSVEIELA